MSTIQEYPESKRSLSADLRSVSFAFTLCRDTNNSVGLLQMASIFHYKSHQKGKQQVHCNDQRVLAYEQ